MEAQKDTDLGKLVSVGRNVKKSIYAELIRKTGAGETLSLAEISVFEKLHREFEAEGQPAATGPTLPNRLAVSAYLKNRGYHASKSVVSKNVTEGKLKPLADGAFSVADVDEYASLYLRRLDGAHTGQSDEAYQQRITEETRKLKAQADHWEIRAAEAAGALRPINFTLNEIAARAIVFNSDIVNWIHSEAPQVCVILEGNPERIADYIAFALTAKDRWLARYTGDREYTVELPAPATQQAKPPDAIERDELELEEA